MSEQLFANLVAKSLALYISRSVYGCWIPVQAWLFIVVQNPLSAGLISRIYEHKQTVESQTKSNYAHVCFCFLIGSTTVRLIIKFKLTCITLYFKKKCFFKPCLIFLVRLKEALQYSIANNPCIIVWHQNKIRPNHVPSRIPRRLYIV